MLYTDISKSDWSALIQSIQKPDHSFNLNDLTRAVAAKFGLDDRTAKRLVRRHDQRMTVKPAAVRRLFNALHDATVNK